MLTAAEWKAALKKWGVKVSYRKGWENHGRPASKGTFEPVGIMIHHTGGPTQGAGYADRLFATVGPRYPALPGPLCHAATGSNGTLYMGATRRANHAGQGARSTLTRVLGSKMPLSKTLLPADADAIDGNRYYYGNEVMYAGSKPPTAKQYQTVVRWCAAICDAEGWDAGRIIGHREHSRRKPDPGRVDMGELRRDVQALLDARKGRHDLPKPGLFRMKKSRVLSYASLNAEKPMSEVDDGPVTMRFGKTAMNKHGQPRGRKHARLKGRWRDIDPGRATRLGD